MKIVAFLVPFSLMFCVFLWQFVVGLVIGKEAGFMVYAIVGLVPLMVRGFPWFEMLVPTGNLDITFDAIGTSLALRYHAAAFISLMLNALIISILLVGLGRLLANRRPRS